MKSRYRKQRMIADYNILGTISFSEVISKMGDGAQHVFTLLVVWKWQGGF